MPRFVCDDCGAVFDSKAELADHECGQGAGEQGSVLDGIRDGIARLRGFSTKQLFVLFGVVLMGTLFVGTAWYYSSISPGGGSTSSPAPRQETSPPVGYTIRSAADIPSVTRDELPNSTVVDEQLSHAVQLNLLTGSATGNGVVLLQYSCTDCNGTATELASIADRFNGGTSWVFVAPYRDMDERIAATAFQRKLSFDAVNETRIETFICTSLRQQPVECAIR